MGIMETTMEDVKTSDEYDGRKKSKLNPLEVLDIEALISNCKNKILYRSIVFYNVVCKCDYMS